MTAALQEDFHKLLDPDEPLDSRLRELYRLKESHLKTAEGVAILLQCVDLTDSVLLQHEVVYNIGQSGRSEAIPSLVSILKDIRVNPHPTSKDTTITTINSIHEEEDEKNEKGNYDVVTRHEAAEALGAIGGSAAVDSLKHFSEEENESEAAIRESCALALARIYMEMKKGKEILQPPTDCPFVSVDPSPAFSAATASLDPSLDPTNTNNNNNNNNNNTSNSNNNTKEEEGAAAEVPTTVPELERVLLNTDRTFTLLQRYMAMFTLRNIGSDAAVDVLCRALRQDTTSALFRHEVAFVLGQLERPRSQPALVACLRDELEIAMVRHEAAEALGAIADPGSLEVLQQYADHSEPIVRDSCVVALELHKYWSNFNNNNNTTSNDNNE